MLAILASTALLASAVTATSVGSAIVLNKCSYEVTLCNVPSADGGYTEIDKTLGTNDTYEQQWTELSNGNGWSIKLSKDTSLSNIMQYEYTFQNDGIIWYDLSDVNGNPWDGNWEITATNALDDCSPKEQAYRYATDDAYGMQACSQDSIITVTLCSGESADDGGAASASSSVAAASSTASIEASTASSTFTTPSASAPTYTSFSWGHGQQANAAGTTTLSAEYFASPTPTTFATATSVSSSSAVYVAPDGVTVTEVATAVVTDVVTATAYAKRDAPHRHHNRHNRA